MLFIYGDSHANFSLGGLPIPLVNRHMNSITMYRIGRDNILINFNPREHDDNSILCFSYGEIDCRCHVQRQIDNGRGEDDVISEIVTNYFRTLKNNIQRNKAVILCAVTPSIRRNDYESVHGPVTHQFPFVGTDDARVRYTQKVNALLEQLCAREGYIFFNPFATYVREDGTLKYELSDGLVHIKDTRVLHAEFMNLYRHICGN